jgi:hypothetical protein
LHVRLWGVRAQIHALDADNVVVSLLVAVLERGITGDVEVVLDHALVITEDAQAAHRRETEGQGNDVGEPHRSKVTDGFTLSS